MAFLEVKNVRKQYANHLALDNVSLEIEKQHVYGLLGPNGAGKTTCFYLVTGLVTALLAGGIPLCRASLAAARLARLLARYCAPDPGTQVAQLLARLPQFLQEHAEAVLAMD